MSDTASRSSSLRSQLSLSSRAASTQLDPALRAALAAQPRRHQPPTDTASVSFAARAVLDPDNPEASLEMFKRLSRGSERRV